MSYKPAFSVTNNGLSQEQAHTIWHSLRKSVEEIQRGNAGSLKFEELYRNAYTLVLHKHGDLLYRGVEECVANKLKLVEAEVATTTNERLLEDLVGKWETHKITMNMIRDVLMYMEKQYCPSSQKPPVFNMGVGLFRDIVVQSSHVGPRLKRLLLENVQRERNGEVIDRGHMKSCLGMLVDVNVSNSDFYVDFFEKDLIAQSRVFYAHESQECLNTSSVPDFLRKIERRIREEESRADNYLDKSTKAKLRAAVQDELIVRHARRVVEDEKSGCVRMFTDEFNEDLARLYDLLSREPATLAVLREAMAALVRDTGTAIVRDPENLKNPRRFVQSLLDTRAKYLNFVLQCFRQDRQFARALRDALEMFINLDSRAAHFLSLYTDELLRTASSSSLGASGVEAKLSEVIDLFRFLHDKDVFEDFYKQQLAQRLLSNTSVDADMEKLMITKLKTECGHQFTSRLEGMFKDMDLSKSMAKGLEVYRKKIGSSAPEMSAKVLTTGFWPVQGSGDCQLPDAAARACEEFKAFYSSLHKGRRLQWQHQLATAELRVNFAKGGRRELLVPALQLVILSLYNHRDSYTYADMLRLTGIGADELQRHLLSLAHPKVRILKKEPNTKAVEAAHTFEFNEAYTSQLYRIKVPVLALAKAEGDEAKEDVSAHVSEARKNHTEAAVVRVMKARKSMEHGQLVAEVMKQLSGRFAVELAFIKKRVESLIEREYLERDASNRMLYHYLA